LPPPPLRTSTLSLHDALPIFPSSTPVPASWQKGSATGGSGGSADRGGAGALRGRDSPAPIRDRSRGSTPFAPRNGLDPRERSRIDRKSTRLNSSHVKISYAVF